MSYFDTAVFCRENLNGRDGEIYSAMDKLLSELLSSDCIGEYLNEIGAAGLRRQLAAESLEGFRAFLADREVLKSDFLIGAIEGYSPEEFFNITGKDINEIG